jgi:hypothetical protein
MARINKVILIMHRKNIVFPLYIVLLVFLNSCINLSDRSIHLYDGMTLIHEGQNYNFVIYNDRILLYPNIYDFKVTKDYIQLYQEIDISMLNSMLPMDYSNIEEIESGNLKDVETIIDNNESLNKQIKHKKAIWIFLKKEKRLTGPFLENQIDSILSEIKL